MEFFQLFSALRSFYVWLLGYLAVSQYRHIILGIFREVSYKKLDILSDLSEVF